MVIPEELLVRFRGRIELCPVVLTPISPRCKTVRVRLPDGHIIKRHLSKHVLLGGS